MKRRRVLLLFLVGAAVLLVVLVRRDWTKPSGHDRTRDAAEQLGRRLAGSGADTAFDLAKLANDRGAVVLTAEDDESGGPRLVLGVTDTDQIRTGRYGAARMETSGACWEYRFDSRSDDFELDGVTCPEQQPIPIPSSGSAFPEGEP